ncbi:carboxynorspermidine decarboxylase [Globicatella sanguinis]|uniref:carboxynorspermidine decarboxylase n=1 Tax=Globicatella sanguinis TaxID=13076 RepID=UPI002543B509|nr:carboxynorspermidine decarboxylase [Globicatella sanguinis]MDK7630838.1 carboxynorspermidine decarboxylase [Globicatella sanguinis]WIK67566.1 carboxynorspermidine decarboxylase [Globicatella sanguinis]WKT56971.1 carboxynorspermidine decarboxylase [Globicatella sanguinis]
MNIPWAVDQVATPAFVVEENLLRHNLEILQEVKSATGCKIFLAQKAFSMYHYYPLIAEYLDGTTASGIYEARLGHEHFPGEVHVYSPAFRDEEMTEILPIADHIVLNSFTQWHRFKHLKNQTKASFGLRVNPNVSTQDGHAIYDPCAPDSRLGILVTDFEGQDLTGIDGLHFHTLCEQDSDDLEITLKAIEAQFGDLLYQMKWLNFGGGHHITRPGYDIERLIRLINHMQTQYDLTVYLEPGEAVALNAGYLVASVLDITHNQGVTNAILDTSATCHMPDVLEMPYRPNIINSGQPNEKAYTYQFGGPTCLAGDIIGTYSFDQPLAIGDKLIFCDMAIYSMVKTNTFNGMPLAKIMATDSQNNLSIINQFDYNEFKRRL